MRMGHGRGMHATGDKTGKVRHVDHEVGADAVSDLAKALEIPGARIGRAAGDDQFWLHLLGAARDLIHIDDLVLAAHGVVLRLEPFAGEVDRRAVGEMSAGGEVEAHKGVAGLQQRQEHRLVHLAAGIGLDVGKASAEQLLGALDRKRFRDVDPFAAAVVTRARIAFRVFVGHHRALRFQDGAADDVFRGDQLDLVPLPAEFTLDRGGDLGIRLRKAGGEEGIGGRGGFGAGRWRVHRQNISNLRNHLNGLRSVLKLRSKRGKPISILPRPGQVIAVQA